MRETAQGSVSYSFNALQCHRTNLSPAIAAMPKTIDSTPVTSPGTTNGSRKQDENGLRPATIVGIVLGDIVGVGILAVIFLYVYQWKKKKNVANAIKTEKNETNSAKDIWSSSSSSSETRGVTAWSCLPKEETKKTAPKPQAPMAKKNRPCKTGHSNQRQQEQQKARRRRRRRRRRRSSSDRDGEKELELEISPQGFGYILGATGSSIMYKAVLEDGTTLAVRRIGESGVERFRDFETSLASARYSEYSSSPSFPAYVSHFWKVGSSPCHMPWEVRLKVAKGAARGLTYLHDKKHVHGNLKPSNILLASTWSPKSAILAWRGSSPAKLATKLVDRPGISGARDRQPPATVPRHASWAQPQPESKLTGRVPYTPPSRSGASSPTRMGCVLIWGHTAGAAHWEGYRLR
ncbi:putative LRR receptor-like serine/threonine-protein kinase [Vitis vinifera]|uniref:Putative LRR receptor-like serine/threonine-protein kinase n=1 Tax=Vitis vinifera TaxID=29760 RepID=A0A438FB68_VITVI|nr:putative LRR receptor-like serine/threonine-protein kinase [Vitis vinifera]